MSTALEQPVVFDCCGNELVGVLHHGDMASKLGVVIIVGGPQYRVGSHRQYVIIARAIASSGYHVLRFDHRGVGDSGGKARSFQSIDDDIRAATDLLFDRCPDVTAVVLFGLCDAASACLMYCNMDSRVRGLILINPWVRTRIGAAHSYLRHYYINRLFQKSFWSNIYSGNIDFRRSVGAFFLNLKSWLRDQNSPTSESMLIEREFLMEMQFGLQRFSDPVLFLTSENDLVAREFVGLCIASENWRSLLDRPNVKLRSIAGADHTMSQREHLDQACGYCIDWLAQRNSALHSTVVVQ